MKKILFILMVVWMCISASACSSEAQPKEEAKAKSDVEKIPSESNAKVKPYKEPLTQVGQKAQHPFGISVLNQLSEPNTKIKAGPLHILVERIKVVHISELSEIGKYNLKERGLNTEEMNAIQLTTTLENISDQPLALGKGPIKTLILSNGEQVDVVKMNADPKDRNLKANEKTKFMLICFLSKDPKNLKYVKVITDIVHNQTTKSAVSAPQTIEIKM